MSIADRIRNVMIDRLGQAAVPAGDLVRLVSSEDSLGPPGPDSPARRVDPPTGHLVRRYRQRGPLRAGAVGRGLVDGLDADDAEEHFVRVHPSLTPISWWLVGHGADLVDVAGDVTGRVETDGLWLEGVDTDVVLGPPGWLDAFVGGWASVTVSDETLRIEPCAQPPLPTARQIDAMRQGFAASAETSEVMLFDGEQRHLTFAVGAQPIHEAMLCDREAFVTDPVPHLPELYAAAGLEERGQIIAEVDFDWDALGQRQRRNLMAIRYRLDERGVDALMMLTGACDLYSTDGASSLGETEDERSGAAILLSALLEDGNVGEGFWAEAQRRARTVEEIAAFAGELDDRMAGVRLVGLTWVRSRCLEETGDVRTAAEMIASFVGRDCGHRPALLDAAGYAADRGDAPGALQLVVQAGVTDEDPADPDPDDDVALLREIVNVATHRPQPTAGRNDPCPCGSCRKYKACHLGRERHSLSDRAAWLFDKATRFVHRHDDELLDELAAELSEQMPELYQQLRDSPFVADLALQEHGLFAEFLTERGWLLPEDEQLLAAQWALVDRGVFEMIDKRAERLRIRNIGTGEMVEIVNATLFARSGPGTTMIGRPLPVGETHRAFGGFLPVPRSAVNQLIDAIAAGDDDELVAIIASTFQPPRLQNTSSEDLSFHTLRWQLDDSNPIGDALCTAGFDERDGNSWSLSIDTPGLSAAVVATLHVDEDNGELVAHVNSDERATLIRERIATALPTARFISDEQRTLAELGEEVDDASGSSAGIDPNDPEMARVLEESSPPKSWSGSTNRFLLSVAAPHVRPSAIRSAAKRFVNCSIPGLNFHPARAPASPATERRASEFCSASTGEQVAPLVGLRFVEMRSVRSRL